MFLCGHVSVSCLWAQGAFCGSPLRWLSYGVLAFPRLFARVAKVVECVAGDLLFVEEGIIANEDDLTCTSVPMYWLCQDMACVVCIQHTQVRGGYELRCNKERRRGFAVLCGCECVANGFVNVVGFVLWCGCDDTLPFEVERVVVCAKELVSGVMGEVGHVWVGCEWAVEHGVCACEMFVEDTLDCGGGCFVRAGSFVALEQVDNLVLERFGLELFVDVFVAAFGLWCWSC